MGNSISSSSVQDNTFDTIIDYIATHYILTMDFKNLTKLSEKAYCDKLIILTSSILERYLTKQEVGYLEQRTKNGVEINNMSKDDVVFLSKDQLDELDVKNDEKKTLKKKRMCIGIAKFYIIIAHIFAAIVMTINPTYRYSDQYGNKMVANLYNKDKIPSGTVKTVSNINICNNRLNALESGMNSDKILKDEIQVSPKVCYTNLNNDNTLKSLNDEPGIPQLRELYNDDKYDYSTGKFTGMSESTSREFKQDLELFYNIFTGNKKMPEDIQDFSDIKLKDYSKSSACQNDSLNNKYTGKKDNKLFKNYAENIKTMVRHANIKQGKLLEIINVLFTFVIDPHTKEKRIRINPTLTETILTESVKKTRTLIIDLYTTCEKDYVKGVQLFEAIVDDIGFKTVSKQKEVLENKRIQLINMDNNRPMEINYINQPPINRPPAINYINQQPVNRPPAINYINQQPNLIKPPTTNYLNQSSSKPLDFKVIQTPINLVDLGKQQKINQLNAQVLVNQRNDINNKVEAIRLKEQYEKDELNKQFKLNEEINKELNMKDKEINSELKQLNLNNGQIANLAVTPNNNGKNPFSFRNFFTRSPLDKKSEPSLNTDKTSIETNQPENQPENQPAIQPENQQENQQEIDTNVEVKTENENNTPTEELTNQDTEQNENNTPTEESEENKTYTFEYYDTADDIYYVVKNNKKFITPTRTFGYNPNVKLIEITKSEQETSIGVEFNEQLAGQHPSAIEGDIKNYTYEYLDVLKNKYYIIKLNNDGKTLVKDEYNTRKYPYNSNVKLVRVNDPTILYYSYFSANNPTDVNHKTPYFTVENGSVNHYEDPSDKRKLGVPILVDQVFDQSLSDSPIQIEDNYKPENIQAYEYYDVIRKHYYTIQPKDKPAEQALDYMYNKLVASTEEYFQKITDNRVHVSNPSVQLVYVNEPYTEYYSTFQEIKETKIIFMSVTRSYYTVNYDTTPNMTEYSEIPQNKNGQVIWIDKPFKLPYGNSYYSEQPESTQPITDTTVEVNTEQPESTKPVTDTTVEVNTENENKTYTFEYHDMADDIYYVVKNNKKFITPTRTFGYNPNVKLIEINDRDEETDIDVEFNEQIAGQHPSAIEGDIKNYTYEYFDVLKNKYYIIKLNDDGKTLVKDEYDTRKYPDNSNVKLVRVNDPNVLYYSHFLAKNPTVFDDQTPYFTVVNGRIAYYKTPPDNKELGVPILVDQVFNESLSESKIIIEDNYRFKNIEAYEYYDVIFQKYYTIQPKNKNTEQSYEYLYNMFVASKEEHYREITDKRVYGRNTLVQLVYVNEPDTEYYSTFRKRSVRHDDKIDTIMSYYTVNYTSDGNPPNSETGNLVFSEFPQNKNGQVIWIDKPFKLPYGNSEFSDQPGGKPKKNKYTKKSKKSTIKKRGNKKKQGRKTYKKRGNKNTRKQ